MKSSVIIGILSCYFFFVVSLNQKELCSRCVRAENCMFYGRMSKQEQEKWSAQNVCENEEEDVGILFGFAPVAKGDYICCPEANIWGIEESGTSEKKSKKVEGKDEFNVDEIYQYDIPENGEDEPNDYEQNRSPNRRRPGSNRGLSNRRNNGRNHITHQPVMNSPENYNMPSQNGPYPNYPNNFRNNRPQSNNPSPRSYPNNNGPQGNGVVYPNQNYPNGNHNSFTPPQSYQRPPNTAFQNPNMNFNGPQNINNAPSNRQPNVFQNPNNPSFNVPQINNGSPVKYPNNIPDFGGQNGNNQGRNQNNDFNQSQDQNSGISASGGQCSSLTSFPPEPRSGCCGRDATADRNLLNRPQNNFLNRRPAPSNQNQWAPANSYPYPRYNRATRDSGNETTDGFSLDNRITGGKETELDQFPWTVLLKTTFDYGNKQSAFNCGGSVISARYILTAAHCVQEDNARVTDVEVYLAEYDKRSFPNDCVNTFEGRKCIENIVMHAEDVIPHPQYDDRKLQNDIALIRLRGNAPYSEYIRPICLPPVDIDNPDYSNLRVAIAGWGRNGRQTSQVKQSAVVHLVTQRECSSSYPQLTRRHLCAAGHSGEDTCKGDSGGPLMMLYEGQYYISGVVSGKRADSPCGTSVPSLYTNVYHYQDWIRSNIRN